MVWDLTKINKIRW